jgi:hypothetical protein
VWVSGDAIGECIRIKGEKMDSIKIAKIAKKNYEVFCQSVDPFLHLDITTSRERVG